MKANIFSIVVVAWLFSTPVFAQPFQGKASYYADKFEGRPTASGEKYRKDMFTAAHRKLPFGTVIRVKNMENQREVVVTVNDRGPFVKGRILDLSRAAAESLDFVLQGTAMVSYEILSEGQENKFLSVNNSPFRPAGWALQLGSFTQRTNAFTFARRMGENYDLDTFIQEIVVGNIPHFRVLAGPYAREIDAEKDKKRIRKNFTNLLIREI